MRMSQMRRATDTTYNDDSPALVIVRRHNKFVSFKRIRKILGRLNTELYQIVIDRQSHYRAGNSLNGLATSLKQAIH